MTDDEDRKALCATARCPQGHAQLPRLRAAFAGVRLCPSASEWQPPRLCPSRLPASDGRPAKGNGCQTLSGRVFSGEKSSRFRSVPIANLAAIRSRHSWSDEDGCWIADVPDLRPCSAHGDTPVEALEEAQVAIGLWLDVARERGFDVPAPGTVTAGLRRAGTPPIPTDTLVLLTAVVAGDAIGIGLVEHGRVVRPARPALQQAAVDRHDIDDRARDRNWSSSNGSG